jgi:periplasmic copper chaperone A
LKNSANKSLLRRTLSATAVAGGTAALMLAGISGASAHVQATPDKTAANSYALLTFGIPHGCDHASTTKITIALPA